MVLADSPDVELFGAKLMGKSKDDVLTVVSQHLDEDVEFEDMFIGESLHSPFKSETPPVLFSS